MTWTLIVAHLTVAWWSGDNAYDHCQTFKRYFTLAPAQCVLQVRI